MKSYLITGSYSKNQKGRIKDDFYTAEIREVKEVLRPVNILELAKQGNKKPRD